MKTIIAGSRGISNWDALTHIEHAVRLCGFPVTEVVSGTARGVDKSGESWADFHEIPVVRFPANWDKYGKQAGYIRNKQMAEYADALIAIWDGKSKGTEHMINLAIDASIKVYVRNLSTDEKTP